MTGSTPSPVPCLSSPLLTAIERWREQGSELARIVLDTASPRPDQRQAEIDSLLALGELQAARSLLHAWLQQLTSLPAQQQAHMGGVWDNPVLWKSVADVVERTGDQWLLELLWRGLERLRPDPWPAQRLPLLGVPILNRPDLLERLLDSLDCPVDTLAVVDNSGGDQAVAALLTRLETTGHPKVAQVRVCRPFRNLGVASSWNAILRAFPEVPYSLVVNNDICFAPGVLAAALGRLDSQRPQWLPLMPFDEAFSAFFLTSLAWNLVGLFDETFYPAYLEDNDYRERMRRYPQLETPPHDDLAAAMAACNPVGSATISSDPQLAACNRRSFPLNRLWYLSHRRLRSDPSGGWMLRRLAGWP
jgi:hypothetical protein